MMTEGLWTGCAPRLLFSFDFPKASINKMIPKHFFVVIYSGYKLLSPLSHEQFTLLIGQASVALDRVAG